MLNENKIKKISYSTKLKFVGFLFVLPVLIYFAVFYFYPIFSAIFNSFFKYDLFTERKFIGLLNYKQIFTDSLFLDSLKITLLYTIGSCILIWLVSFGLALLLNHEFPLRNFYRTVFFMPLVISLVVVALIWKVMFQEQGLVNSILNTNIEWLTSSNLAIWVIIFLSIWKWSGFYMILFLAGLNGIAPTYYEAAKIDGCNTRGLFRYITIPLLKPTFTFVMVVSLIGAVKIFEPMYIITRGGPAGSTMVLALRIYETAFKSFEMGRASAMSMVLFVILLIFTLLQFRFLDIKEG